MPFDDFCARRRSNQLITKFVCASVSWFPTPAEVQRRYEERLESHYTRPAETRLRLLRICDDPDAQSVRRLESLDPVIVERVRARTWDGRVFIEDLRERIATGELTFAQAQRKFSMDLNTAETVHVQDHAPGEEPAPLPWPLREPEAQLPVGEVSQVMGTSTGWYLLQVTARTERRVIPLDEVRRELEAELEADAWPRLRDAWIAQLRARARVELH